MIIGYGEDSLTLWALRNNIKTILPKIIDIDGAIILYRPSFGRNGGYSHSGFGEFDAIIGYDKNIALIESKWVDDRKKTRKYTLEPIQIRRHKIFKLYFELWNRQNWTSWEDFRCSCYKEFNKRSNGKTIPLISTKLGCNLEYTLKLLKHYYVDKNSIEDILLVFKPKKSIQNNWSASGFKIVEIAYIPESRGGHIKIE